MPTGLMGWPIFLIEAGHKALNLRLQICQPRTYGVDKSDHLKISSEYSTSSGIKSNKGALTGAFTAKIME